MAEEPVQPAADGIVAAARDASDLLDGVVLVGEQDHLGAEAGAWARRLPEELLQAGELAPTHRGYVAVDE